MIVEIVLAGFVLWAAGIVTWILHENLHLTRKAQNALLTLTDKQAAVTAVGIDRAEATPMLSAKDIADKKKKKLEEAHDARMYEEIEAATSLTPEMEEFLQRKGHM